MLKISVLIQGETLSLMYGGGSRAGLAGLQEERERAGGVTVRFIRTTIIMRLQSSNILSPHSGSTD